MDVLSLLKKDHAAVKELFREAEELGDRAFAARQRIFSQIAQELSVHSEAEETIFYPALKEREKADSEGRQEVLEAYEEHSVVKYVIGQLKSLDPKDESYKAKLQVLGELVDHHVKEEESQMFKQAREAFSKDELSALGDQLAKAKERKLSAV